MSIQGNIVVKISQRPDLEAGQWFSQTVHDKTTNKTHVYLFQRSASQRGLGTRISDFLNGIRPAKSKANTHLHKALMHPTFAVAGLADIKSKILNTKPPTPDPASGKNSLLHRTTITGKRNDIQTDDLVVSAEDSSRVADDAGSGDVENTSQISGDEDASTHSDDAGSEGESLHDAEELPTTVAFGRSQHTDTTAKNSANRVQATIPSIKISDAFNTASVKKNEWREKIDEFFPSPTSNTETSSAKKPSSAISSSIRESATQTRLKNAIYYAIDVEHGLARPKSKSEIKAMIDYVDEFLLHAARSLNKIDIPDEIQTLYEALSNKLHN